MSITDELRKWGYGFCGSSYEVVNAIADRIDAEHEALRDQLETSERQKESYREDLLAANRQVHASYNDGYDEGFANADDWLAQHEDAMAEHGWVKGPLDADGKMWRSGDMSDSNWGVIEGIAYEDGRWLVSGHDTSAPWIPADSIRHYHEPTVEDVLREACNAYHSLLIEGMSDVAHDMPAPSEIIAEYSAKLRLANDGEEQ